MAFCPLLSPKKHSTTFQPSIFPGKNTNTSIIFSRVFHAQRAVCDTFSVCRADLAAGPKPCRIAGGYQRVELAILQLCCRLFSAASRMAIMFAHVKSDDSVY